jgi:hypothetical protein
MTYFPQNPNGQNTNENSAPVTISSDQLGDNTFATDESLIILRRIAKLLESNATVTTGQRQLVVVDSITAGTLTTVSNITTVASMDHRQFIDMSRVAFANCIRNNLNFS